MKEIIYRQAGLPVFQNKVYADQEAAKNAVIGDVELVQCAMSGLVYNQAFNPRLLDYDENYQNEQACSPSFQKHLEDVLNIVLRHFGKKNKGVEIGCGKGYFFEMLSDAGASIVGYDPAYQGDNPNVRKSYYEGGLNETKPAYIVLRHVLEHIPAPWDFLAKMASECQEQCGIYIEVPCLDWIVEQGAFYDIFYEHCNYFTLDVLKGAFDRIFGTGRLFGNQYLYLVADLSTYHRPRHYQGRRFPPLAFQHQLTNILRRQLPGRPSYIWGAGAKGITFANLLWRQGMVVEALIDINPAKQGKFIGLSGLPILAPEAIGAGLENANVLVMNPVYLNEIRNSLLDFNVNLISVA